MLIEERPRRRRFLVGNLTCTSPESLIRCYLVKPTSGAFGGLTVANLGRRPFVHANSTTMAETVQMQKYDKTNCRKEALFLLCYNYSTNLEIRHQLWCNKGKQETLHNSKSRKSSKPRHLQESRNQRGGRNLKAEKGAVLHQQVGPGKKTNRGYPSLLW